MPERPENVPAGARWNRELRAWSHGEYDPEGRARGAHEVYNDQGTLTSRVRYREGELDGSFEDYHPNGELARRGEYRSGKIEGECVRFASTGPTRQPLRNCCVPPGAWSMRARFAAGRCLF